MFKLNRKNVGENIRKNRLTKDLSQENLADSLGKNVSTISRFERGKLLPVASIFHQLENVILHKKM